MKIKIFWIILTLWISLLAAFLLIAQEGRGIGRISGTVMDESGNPVEGVLITIEAARFNFKTTATSDKKGHWACVGLGTGSFKITASKEGYTSVEFMMNISQFKNPPRDIILKRNPDPLFLKGGESGRDEAARLLNEANSLFDQQNYAGALALFQEFLEKNPQLYQIRLNIGNCYREMKKYDQALEEYYSVLEKIKAEKPEFSGDENAARALAGIGETYLAQNMLDKAQEFLQKAIDIYPTDHALAYNVAEIFFQAGQVDLAIQYYQLAIQIKPSWPLAYLKMGYAHVNKNNYEEAIRLFQKFLELAPQDPQVENVKSLIEQLKKK